MDSFDRSQDIDWKEILHHLLAIKNGLFRWDQPKVFRQMARSFHLIVYLFFGRTMGNVELPWPRMEPMPPPVEVRSLKHWTTREVQIGVNDLWVRSFIFHVKSLEPLKAPVGRVVIHEFQHTASSPKHSDYFLKLTVTHRLLFAHDMNVRKWYEDLLWIAFSSKQCFNWLVWNVHGHLNKNVPGPCSSSVVIFTMGLPNMKLAFFSGTKRIVGED